jgi:hypothetical protein
VSVFEMGIVNGVILILALGANGLMERWRRSSVRETADSLSTSAPA